MSSDEFDPPSRASTGKTNSTKPELTRSDERVLAYLVGVESEYPALIAGNTGLHVAHVDRRLEALRDVGLVETGSDGTTYRLTERGRDVSGGSSSPS